VRIPVLGLAEVLLPIVVLTGSTPATVKVRLIPKHLREEVCG
jgi:hypothetical protein